MAGYRTNPRFDSLLAKVVGRSTTACFADALARTARALDAFTVEGVATNLPLLRALLRHPAVRALRVHTRFVEEHAAELAIPDDPATRTSPALAGARVDAVDPLAVLAHGKSAAPEPLRGDAEADGAHNGMVVVAAPMQGTVIGVEVDEEFTITWPTGEFGGMGLEGSVKLGYRNELAAIADPAERRAAFEEKVARAYEHGKALSMASVFEIDDVIDPADSRARITSALRAMPPPAPRQGKKRPCVDTW